MTMRWNTISATFNSSLSLQECSTIIDFAWYGDTEFFFKQRKLNENLNVLLKYIED